MPCIADSCFSFCPDAGAENTGVLMQEKMTYSAAGVDIDRTHTIKERIKTLNQTYSINHLE